MPLRCSAPGSMQSRVQATRLPSRGGIFRSIPARVTSGTMLPSLAINNAGLARRK